MPTSAPTDDPLGGLPVLLVSDDPPSRDRLTLLLCAYGAQLRVTSTAPQCLAAFASHSASVLVVDLASVDDAIWLMEQIRSLDPALPSLALGAASSVEHRERILRAGYRQHAPKPIRPHQLARLLISLAPDEPPA